jgi:23S rRNA (adenine2503-C2)-methyltransferase
MFRYSRIKLNLIPLNLPDSSEMPTAEEMDRFIKELEIMNVPISVRNSSGRDIDGACGQLAGRSHTAEKRR